MPSFRRMAGSVFGCRAIFNGALFEYLHWDSHSPLGDVRLTLLTSTLVAMALGVLVFGLGVLGSRRLVWVAAIVGGAIVLANAFLVFIPALSAR